LRLRIEGFLGLFALSGIASEAQKSHDEVIDREVAARGSGE
jgi:hypothetical protein